MALLAATLLLADAALAQSAPDAYVVQTMSRVVTLDPAAAQDLGSLMVVENLYETLYSYAGGEVEELVPALATSYVASADATRWTFTLRPGVRFHSGNLLSCKDVDYSFTYYAITAQPQSVAVTLLGRRWLGSELDGSDRDAFLAALDWVDIDALVTCPDGPDGLTVEVRLREPTGPLLAILANPGFSVLDRRHAVAGGAWDGTAASWREWVGRDLTAEFLHANPSGTGAFRLVAWSSDGVAAEAFEDYWGAAPGVRQVAVRYVDDQASRLQALASGEADRVEVTERQALDALGPEAGVTVHEADDWTFATITAIFFNFDVVAGDPEAVGSGQLDGDGIPSDFFADVDVRRAFAHLFDQEGFVDTVYGGRGVVLSAALPPSFPASDAAGPVRSLDPEAAAEHFRAAFGGRLWDTGFRFSAYYNAGNSVRRDALEMLKGNLELLNPRFKMDVRALAWEDFLALVADGRAPLFVLSWGADHGDPSAFIDTFFARDGLFSQRTHVDLPELQELIAAASLETEPRQRVRAYGRVAELHWDLAPALVVPQQIWFIAARSELAGIYFNPLLAGQFLWRDVYKR